MALFKTYATIIDTIIESQNNSMSCKDPTYEENNMPAYK